MPLKYKEKRNSSTCCFQKTFYPITGLHKIKYSPIYFWHQRSLMSTVASKKKKLRAKEVQTKHFLRSFTHLFNPSCYHMYWCMWHNVKLHFKLQHILYTMELLTKISFRFLNLKLISWLPTYKEDLSYFKQALKVGFSEEEESHTMYLSWNIKCQKCLGIVRNGFIYLKQ